MPSSNAQYTALADSATAAATAIASDPRFGFFQKLREERLGQLRPLSDFFDKNRISRPTSAAEISSRLNPTRPPLQHYQPLPSRRHCPPRRRSPVCFEARLGAFRDRRHDHHFISNVRCPDWSVHPASVDLVGGIHRLLDCRWVVSAAAVIIGGHAAFLEPSIEGDFASGSITV
ncbi:hypothetical protein BC937DRAFT_87344 [Endogone sp. FLAS-F59071]|nr:hypothetical protein BC937DRAFT_87344 [Endogone sp. FLAS-F59071]|eukprot:RUS23333.1 hypothetical protein BC937DRAFT_87344 [Endogone sp. FLAS-F59071]